MENLGSEQIQQSTTTTAKDDDLQTLGEIAYTAYCESLGGVSINGDKLPTYGDQYEHIRAAWQSVGDTVAAATIAGIQSGLADLARAIMGEDSE